MNKMTAVENNICSCISAAYPCSNAIFVVNKRTRSKIVCGIPDSGFPATKITAIVSPIARPTPKITPVKIPDLAAGNTTLKIVCIFEAPSANDPSL